MTEHLSQPASHVQPEITEARIARQWSAMEQRGLPGPAVVGVRGRWRAGGLVACALLVLAAWRGLMSQPTPTRGSLIESAEEPITLRLHDGSSVALAPQTRLQLVRDQDSSVELSLREGRVQLDVTHVRGRSFSISAGPALVNVVGTRFDVARLLRPEGTLVQVSVQRGVVEVRRRDQDGSVRRLSAGEEWSAFVPPAPAAAAPPMAAALPAAAPAPSAAEAVAPELATAAAEAALDDAPPGADVGAEPHVASAGVKARTLFARANVARRAGRLTEAAAAYAALLRHYPRDARAGIAAFELGRIRMDVLSDARGAIEAFTQALRSSPGAGFREDALARLVLARDTLGERAACERARAAYLGAYPHGVHALALAARCGGH